MIPESDYTDIVNIWGAAFGDDEDFVASYVNEFSNKENYAVERNSDGEAMGMVHFPSFKSENGMKVAYIYALAVEEKYRNRGIARSMVQKVFTDTANDIVVTIPEPESLQQWYRAQFGFELQRGKVEILKDLDFDLGTGCEEKNVFMVRVINVENYLRYYAQTHKDVKMTLKVIDRLDARNNNSYIISDGALNKINVETSNIKEIDISSIYFNFPVDI